MRNIIYTIMAATLLTACEKTPLPAQKSFNISLYDLKGQKLDEVYSGLIVKIVDQQLLSVNKEVDLRKNGIIVFDKKEVPILEAGDDYIITAVPVMDYTDAGRLSINLSYFSRYLRFCDACIIYRPTVTGTILAGFVDGVADGTFEWPAEMSSDAAGNLYVIDQKAVHDVVLKVTPAGITTVFAGAANEFGRLTGIGIDNTRNLAYVSDATAQRVFSINLASGFVSLLAGSGIAGNTNGTGTAASFRFNINRVDDTGAGERGQGLCVDESGNIYVGEQYGISENNSDIRKITPGGVVTIVPGSIIIPTSELEIGVPSGLTVTASGDIYYTQGVSTMFQGISKLSDGIITKIAGKRSFEEFTDGNGNIAAFTCPKAIQHKGEYNYIADASNGALRRVNAAGTVITLAGVGRNMTNTYSDGHLPPIEGSYRLPISFTTPDVFQISARTIRMDQVAGISIPEEGLIYISDHGYKCIWKITIR